MKLLKLAVAVMAFAACGVVAQGPTAAPVDGEQRAAVKELLDAMNFKHVMAQMGGAMTQQMPKMIDQMLDGFSGNGKLTPEQKAEARKIAQQASAGSSKQLLEMYNDPQFIRGVEDIMARAYGRHFTTDEIKATTAFYTSPAGKKALTVMPQMMQETMPEMMAVMAPRMNAMMEKMAQDVFSRVERNSEAKGANATK